MFYRLTLALLVVVQFGCASMSLPEKNASLLRAAATGDLATVQRMIDLGAQVNFGNRQGDTALHLAVKNRHPQVATVLIAKGANVNQPNALGDTPLHTSVYTKQDEVAQRLRDSGASETVLNKYGLNPAEMSSVPEVEAAVEALAALLTPGGQWSDAKSARPRYDDLKRRQDKFLLNALVLQTIRGGVNRFRTIILSIKLGISGSEDKLGALLMAYGDKGMAEDYLNSGSNTLHSWASRWATANGYNIRTGPGSRRANWGSF